MSDLSFFEKRKLEQLFDMGGGYVLDFSNRTFQEFVAESTGRDIYDRKYDYSSGSKANRLRGFWKEEPNHVVGKLCSDLLEYCRTSSDDEERSKVITECRRIVARLMQGTSVDAIEAIVPESSERGFEVLARAVRDAIEKNEPELGLDRLHTYVTKLVRTLSEKRGFSVGKDDPLHSVFGVYVKCLRNAGLIESDMTERILKTSISTMEAFNHIRNNRSLAHDNPVLSYDESLLIYNHVCSAIRFIRALESRASKKGQRVPVDVAATAEIPF